MFSLRTLLLAVVVVAIGVAGLTTRNVWWASVIAIFTWMSVSAAIIIAISVRGMPRCSSVGFAVCGASYLCIVFGQPFQIFASSLLTSRVVISAWQALDIQRPPPQSSGGLIIGPSTDIENVNLIPYLNWNSAEGVDYYYHLRSFHIVAHCLWAWLFGSLGALFAGYLARQRSAQIEPCR
jgi:hypothetical protein